MAAGTHWCPPDIGVRRIVRRGVYPCRCIDIGAYRPKTLASLGETNGISDHCKADGLSAGAPVTFRYFIDNHEHIGGLIWIYGLPAIATIAALTAICTSVL